MSTIEPGTPVRVIIDGYIDEQGVQLGQYAERTGVRTASGAWAGFPFDDPAVQVAPVDPERPTLVEVIADHHAVWRPTASRYECICGWSSEDEEHPDHLAAELRAARVAF